MVRQAKLGFQAWFFRSSALSVMSNLRIIATMAVIGGFPAATIRSYASWMTLLLRIAQSVGMYSAART